MAQKRMFSNSVVGSDSFLEMPDSSQNLYFHLSMQADDDGFVDNWKSIMRMTGKKEDDLKILIAKSFILPFETGILVIRHWRLNNYIQKDRYKETIHKAEKSLLATDENNVYTLDTDCIHRIDKNSIDNICPSDDEPDDEKSDILLQDFEKIWEIYPRKDGKSKAFKSYTSWLKGKKILGKTVKLTNKEMWLAVKKYADESKGKDRTYIKMGSTFFNDAILDYVEASDEQV